MLRMYVICLLSDTAVTFAIEDAR